MLVCTHKKRLQRLFIGAVTLITASTFAAEKPWNNEQLSFDARTDALISAMTLDEKISQLSDESPAIERLGVPKYNWWNEALHGVARNGKATIFPQVIGLAATFDPELSYQMADAISSEARAKYNISQAMGNREKYTGLTFWSPNINIFRDPRWGRGQETFGESPLLTSIMADAFVRGIQGDHSKYLKAAAAAKHFGVHSGPEALRHSFDAVPTQKDLYETYLPAFEYLITKSNVAGLMCAYNAVFGEPACSSEFLLTELLKKQWQFKGYVVSDCGALYDIHHGHKQVKTPEQAAAKALNGGVSLNCGFTYNASLKQAVEQGFASEQTIDERLKELYLIRFRLGFFDGAEANPYNAIPASVINSPEHLALAKEVATKSIVLLKNNNHVLPLDKNIKVPYVTGPFAASSDVLMANYYGISGNMVTILEGIANKVSQGSALNYRMGALPFNDNKNPKNWAPFVAKTADAVIAVVGISADMEGEEVDAIASEHKGDRVDLKLPQNQINYVKQLAENKKGPLVLVVASGSPVALGELYDLADAVVQVWYPGEQGGNAVADVLFGDANPSGHLPLTFPHSVEQLPPYEDYRMQGRTYKFMEQEPLFPFGFGLSYAEFEYRDLKITQNDSSYRVSFEVLNVSKRAGSDVAQLYLTPINPSDEEAKFHLKGFKRLQVEAGDATRHEFVVPHSALTRMTKKGESVALAGQYRLHVANALPIQRSLELGAAKPISQVIEFTH
ncbi:glycoside hydrolase family 3 C-terminal domain-containing protein [Echinimonas agarilytica]|uniref:Glycoside hydrolase family 3 C-terminal domain-containing protein n=1 Tax=Echinimonas agarilytica TaxID=1215918 RepID=A0AA41W441_9GAMM|nr:glycoside hydrolase family 3 C-terminal domain-containing protein [Echinimonas agarilytica]MCM2678365.1 glycoside hydrolase family 3 C-terminal domain-containing protein [Echinimonas agarilytica]